MVDRSPATDSSMNLRKTGCTCSSYRCKGIIGCILPQNPLGSITFRRSRLDANLCLCPTGAAASIYSPDLPEHSQDLRPSRNRAFMGSRPSCEVHHDHHPLRSTATRRALGTFTQDAGALACYPHRVTVHPAAWQGHLPTVRHQDRRKRMPGVIDYRVLQAHQTVRAAIGRRAMLTAIMAMTQ